MANCDEFILYGRSRARESEEAEPQEESAAAEGGAAAKAAPAEPDKKQEALDPRDGDDRGAVRGAHVGGENLGLDVKQALKRRKPGFKESYYGYRSFGKLLDEANRAASSRSNRMKNQAASLSRL